MEFNDIPQENILDGLTNEENKNKETSSQKKHSVKIQDTINSLTANIIDSAEIVEIIKKSNPKYESLTLEQLGKNEEFQQELKEYIAKNFELQAKSKITIEAFKSAVPKNHIKANNKLANKITRDIVDEGEVELVISNRKSKKEVTTKVMLAFDNSQIQLSGKEKYTPYDREVYDGVVTLYEVGNEFITPAMVYRAMNGLTDKEYVSMQSIESVTKSLDKSRYIQVNIDYTEEAKLYNKKIEKTIYQGYLLAAEKVIVKINGNEQEGYKLLRKPILYEYAQISGQIITVPSKLLQTKDAVRSTDEVIVIRGYLLRQIEWIKNEKTERNTNITYKGIYDELEVTRDLYEEIPYKKKTAKIRSHVKAILDEWQEQKYIKKYEEYQEGKTLRGIMLAV